MKCSYCGFRFNAGKTCPSCGHNDSEIGSPKRVYARQIKCGKCGFRYDFGEYCPSCGNANAVRDPEPLAQNYAKNYVDRTKPKSWVLIVSIIGIVYYATLSLMNVLRLIETQYSLICIVLIVLFVARILLFINLMQTKKWALWGLRILSTLSTLSWILSAVLQLTHRLLLFDPNSILYGLSLTNIYFLPNCVGLIWTIAFWFADWFD